MPALINNLPVRLGPLTAPREDVAACQALLVDDWFDGYFGGVEVEFEEDPVSILSKSNVDVCLMIQWQRNFDFGDETLKINMNQPNVKSMLLHLASMGTNYRVFFNYLAYTATWQFVKIGDMAKFTDGDKHNGRKGGHLRPTNLELPPMNYWGYIEAVE